MPITKQELVGPIIVVLLTAALTSSCTIAGVALVVWKDLAVLDAKVSDLRMDMNQHVDIAHK